MSGDAICIAIFAVLACILLNGSNRARRLRRQQQFERNYLVSGRKDTL